MKARKELYSILLLLETVLASNVRVRSPDNESDHAKEEARRRKLQRLEWTENYSKGDDTTTATFKILQIADLHLGEGPNSEWGPKQDDKTFAVLDAIIPLEQPDLIVLSGDQLTANEMDQGATDLYRQLLERLAVYKIPWAAVFGNHDDMPCEYYDEQLIQTDHSSASRKDLFEVDHSFAPLSLTEKGPSNLFGTSNYILDVHPGSSLSSSSSSSDVALQVLFLDSGGGSLPQQLESNQLEWFKEKRSVNAAIPLIAFQHIPTDDFNVADDHACKGLHDQGISSIRDDPGLVKALMDDGNVLFLAVGHNHGNDRCCPLQNNGSEIKMSLCYGRHTGYGGFGNWDRGGRVYEISFHNKNEAQPEITWKSWVRMESGDIIDEYSPPPTLVEVSEDDGSKDEEE